jgi:hypothetical protein
LFSDIIISLFEPTFLLPGIQISGLRPEFSRSEVRTFNRIYAPAPVGFSPAKFDLSITVCAIHIKLVIARVVLRLENLILFRFGRRVFFCEFTEVTPLDFIAIIFLNFFLEFKDPCVIRFERSPFLPGFTFRSRENVPNARNGQIMTAACFTGKLPGLIVIHSHTPFITMSISRV